MSPTRVELVNPQEARGNILKDIAAGFFALACAAVLALHHFEQEGRLHQDFGAEPGPALLPELLMALLASNGALLVTRGGWKLAATRERRLFHPLGAFATWRTAAIYAAALTFAAVQDQLGFGLALCVLGAVLSLLCMPRVGQHRLRPMIEGALLSLALYAVFRYGLSVPLT